MIRKFLTSLIIFIGLTTLVNAECNFRIVEFGDSKESIKISKDEPTPIILPDQFGGESIIMPVEALCKDQQELYGSSVIFLFPIGPVVFWERTLMKPALTESLRHTPN